MINLIKIQMKTMFQQIGVRVTFYLLTLAVVVNYVINLQQYKYVDRATINNFTDFCLLSGNNCPGWYVITLIWFLLVLPGGLSLAIDKKLNIDIYLVTRSHGKNKYLTSKIIATYLTTFFCIMIPFSIELLLNVCAFPIEASKKMLDISNEYYIAMGQTVDKDMFLYDYYTGNPILYTIIRILIMSALLAFLSLIPLAFSCIYNKYLSYLMIPVYFLLELFYNTNFDVFGHKIIHKYFSYIRFDSGSLRGEHVIWFFVLIGIVSCISISFIYVYERKKEV